MKTAPNLPKLLRRASSCTSPASLPAFLSTHEISLSDLQLPSSDGKNALHMACWMGHIDNVALLLDLGCDINAISVGKHNYGKTPIFYATTRARYDVVRFLLNDYGCGEGVNVRIVNNKGQSVYSLAHSHNFDEDILKKIRKLEVDQQNTYDRDHPDDGVAIGPTDERDNYRGWIDYSSTHSDGCTYGDLDFRFLGRPLTDDDVVKDGAVVNPTTRESRRGNFARNNPHVVRSDGDDQIMVGRREKEQNKSSGLLTVEQEVHLEQLWTDVHTSLQSQNSWGLFSSLLAIVHCWEGAKTRSPWIADSFSSLLYLIKFEIVWIDALPFFHDEEDGEEPNADMNNGELKEVNFHSVLSEAMVFCGSGGRHATLVKRILIKTNEGLIIPSSVKDHPPTDLERKRLDHFWKDFEAAIVNRSSKNTFTALINIVIFLDSKSNSSWMQSCADQLHAILKSNSISIGDRVFDSIVLRCKASRNRYVLLVKRVLTKPADGAHNEFSTFDISEQPEKQDVKPLRINRSIKMMKNELSNRFCSFIKSLENDVARNSNLPTWNTLKHSYLPSKSNDKQLSLPQAPSFVDCADELRKLESKLREVASFSDSSHLMTEELSIRFESLIAFDSEFSTSNDGRTELATIQLSVIEDGIPHAWVVDLLPRDSFDMGNSSNEKEQSYYSATCGILRWLFLESPSHLVGFAHHHDLNMLSSYMGEDMISFHSSASKLWDLQLLVAWRMVEEDAHRYNDEGGSYSTLAQLPGLKACCSYYLRGDAVDDEWSLSKREQCSDWRRRPLSEDQLDYAGLDAAVLLVLLSELVRRC